MSFISWIAIGGVTLGVAALVVAMSVMNGYQTNLIRAMAGALPHLSLHALSADGLPPREELEAIVRERLRPITISPYVLHETLLSGPRSKGGSGGGSLQGVLVRAIDPATQSRVPQLLAFLDDGSPDWKTLAPEERLQRSRRLLLRLEAERAPGVAPALLSRMLARKLGVGLGERLTPLELPAGGEGFSPLPTATRLEVIGWLETGIVAFDELVVVMDVKRVGEVFPGKTHQPALGMRLADPLQASEGAEWLRGELVRRGGSAFVYSWLESNGGLFRVIQVQKTMLFLVLTLIVILALFGMVSALIMMVGEKSREITILKSLGARDRSIYRIFLTQGVLIGLMGTGFGLAAGLGVCWVLDTFPLFSIPPGVYPGSDRVPVRVAGGDLLLVVLTTFAACLVATVLPARKAMAIQPADGLRQG